MTVLDHSFFCPLPHDEILRSARGKVSLQRVFAEITCYQKRSSNAREQRSSSTSQAGRRELALATYIFYSFCFNTRLCILATRFDFLLFLIRERFMSHAVRSFSACVLGKSNRGFGHVGDWKQVSSNPVEQEWAPVSPPWWRTHANTLIATFSCAGYIQLRLRAFL